MGTYVPSTEPLRKGAGQMVSQVQRSEVMTKETKKSEVDSVLEMGKWKEITPNPR